MKKVFSVIIKFIKEFFTKNWGMKIGALAFAFLLWTFVMAETNPPREKEFRNIPVSFINVESLRQKNLATQTALQDIIKTANVTVRAESSALQYINEATITATVDLSKVNIEGAHTLPVDAVCSLGTVAKVVKVNPVEVEFVVDEIMERSIPVEVNIVGDKADWLYYGEPVLADKTVVVTGGRTIIEKISKAAINIDVTNMVLPKKEAMQVSLIDANGDVMDSKLFTGVPSSIVEMPVYPKKNVPIDIDAITKNISGVLPGYEISEITVEPENVDIAGKIENINSATKVEIEPIVLSSADKDITVQAKIIVPEGIIAVAPPEVTVHIKINQLEEKRAYNAVDVTTKNLDKALKAELNPESIDVDVYGTIEQFTSFSADNIKPFVDLQGLAVGTHKVTVKFENEPDFAVRIVPVTTTIEVKIT